jgi:hypothetical protein
VWVLHVVLILVGALFLRGFGHLLLLLGGKGGGIECVFTLWLDGFSRIPI